MNEEKTRVLIQAGPEGVRISHETRDEALERLTQERDAALAVERELRIGLEGLHRDWCDVHEEGCDCGVNRLLNDADAVRRKALAALEQPK